MTGVDLALLLAGCALGLTLALGWRLAGLAARLDRAHARVDRTWAALDRALAARARRAVEAALAPGVDPATALLVADAAERALVPGLSRPEREHAESALGHVLALVTLSGVHPAQRRAALARRLHNDAVASCQALRRRGAVRWFRLAGHAAEPIPFEMADFAPTEDSGEALDGRELQLVWRQS